MKTLRIALAQINPTVGDLEGNKKLISNYIKKAKKDKMSKKRIVALLQKSGWQKSAIEKAYKKT